MQCYIEDTSFVFNLDNNNKIYLSFGGEFWGKTKIIVNNTKETLLKFREKFLNNEQCFLLLTDGYGILIIKLYDDMVNFSVEYKKLTFYTTSLNIQYDLCKDAIIQCIDYHISNYL